jgi:hypothetical protein
MLPDELKHMVQCKSTNKTLFDGIPPWELNFEIAKFQVWCSWSIKDFSVLLDVPKTQYRIRKLFLYHCTTAGGCNLQGDTWRQSLPHLSLHLRCSGRASKDRTLVKAWRKLQARGRTHSDNLRWMFPKKKKISWWPDTLSRWGNLRFVFPARTEKSPVLLAIFTSGTSQVDIPRWLSTLSSGETTET